MSLLKKLVMAISLAVFLISVAPATLANEQGTETGDDVAIILDLVVLRPIGLVATVAGTIIFVGSLPISLPTLSVGKTFNAFVVNPAYYTFARKLGEEQ